MTTSTREPPTECGLRLSEIMSSPSNWVMYYLGDGTERASMKEELMLIPENTKLPPDFV